MENGTTTQDEQDLWNRIIKKRAEDCLKLDPQVLNGILQDCAGTDVHPSHAHASPVDTIVGLMRQHIPIFTAKEKASAVAANRRKSYDIVQKIFRRIDEEKAKVSQPSAAEIAAEAEGTRKRQDTVSRQSLSLVAVSANHPPCAAQPTSTNVTTAAANPSQQNTATSSPPLVKRRWDNVSAKTNAAANIPPMQKASNGQPVSDNRPTRESRPAASENSSPQAQPPSIPGRAALDRMNSIGASAAALIAKKTIETSGPRTISEEPASTSRAVGGSSISSTRQRCTDQLTSHAHALAQNDGLDSIAIADPVKSSAPFLVRYTGPDRKTLVDGKFRCLLCQKQGIQANHVANHCRKHDHLNKLAAKIRPTNELRARRKQANPNIANASSGQSDQVAGSNRPARQAADQVARAVRPGYQPLHTAVTFLAREDRKPTAACTIDERPETTKVTFTPINSVGPSTEERIASRLNRWDPFWKSDLLRIGVTTKVDNADPATSLIKSAAQFDLSFPPNSRVQLCIPDARWGKKRDAARWMSGDTALLLRMLPADPRAYKQKRADFHMWPKGTFLQINGKPVTLQQRKQQSHNAFEWKGLSREFDATEVIEDLKRQRNVFELCCYDDQQFIYALALCKYRSVDDLFTALTDPRSKEAIKHLTREESMQKATEFVQRGNVTVDCEDEDEHDEDAERIVFSLTCPISRSILQMPVRGKYCKHWQCCDLRNYISSNVCVSGTRWRCASCEGFVSLGDLEYCGLTAHMLKEFEKVASVDRDRVELCADGSYKLQRKAERGKGKKRPNPEADPAPHSKSPKLNDNEVIEILE